MLDFMVHPHDCYTLNTMASGIMANRMVDMRGWNFGKLTVVQPSTRRDTKGGYYWQCECECGTRKDVSGSNLRSGHINSCGCERDRLSSERRIASKKPPQDCSVAGCDQTVGKSGAKGMCPAHYMRVKRYGDPAYITPEAIRALNNRLAQPNLESANPATYYKYFGKHAHRCVMADVLDRNLRSDECVHHKDYDKHNNHPDNLEVLSRAEHLRVHLPDMLARRKEKHGY